MTKPNGEWWVGQVDLDRASVVLHLSRSFELSKAASHEDRTLAPSVPERSIFLVPRVQVAVVNVPAWARMVL